MKRGTTLVVGAIVLGLAGAAYLARGEIGVAQMRRVAANSIFSDTIATLRMVCMWHFAARVRRFLPRLAPAHARRS